MRLTTAQFRIGVRSELEARQAETSYQTARNDIAVLRTRIAQDRNAIDLLVGKPVEPASLPAALGDARAGIEVHEQIAAQSARANAAQVAASLSNARYRAGVDSFPTSLDAQRTAYAAQQQLMGKRLARGANLVELYRTLCGGLD